MGFLDRLLGREEPRPTGSQQQNAGYPPYGAQTAGTAAGANAAATGAPAQQRSEDEIAVERYRYLLRTAPPETIEQVHEEAFAKLTADQRRLVFEQLSQNAPAGEQPRSDDARSLAQAATRSELRQPGILERSLGGNAFGGGRGGYGGPGLGGMFATSLLGSVAGYVIGSAIVSSFLPPVGVQADAGSGDQNADSGNDAGGDTGGGDTGGGDTGGQGADAGSTQAAGWDGGSGSDAGGWGGDTGGAGADGGWGAGDWGGGDFGGGGFGGGDFGGGDFI